MTTTRVMNLRTSILVLLLAGLFVPFIPSPGLGDDADAAPSQLIQVISVGLLDHDVSDLWSGFRREEGADFNAEIAFKSLHEFDLISCSPFDLDLLVYPAAGFSINNRGDTSKLYGDLRFEFRFDSVLFFVLGAGGAVHDGKLDTMRRDRKSLGSRLLFHIPIELGLEIEEHHRVSLFFDHVSNAYLADKNEGLDTLGLRYGYKF